MKPVRYWQHVDPIECPAGHKMIWLGSVYWICSICQVIYVQVAQPRKSE